MGGCSIDRYLSLHCNMPCSSNKCHSDRICMTFSLISLMRKLKTFPWNTVDYTLGVFHTSGQKNETRLSYSFLEWLAYVQGMALGNKKTDLSDRSTYVYMYTTVKQTHVDQSCLGISCYYPLMGWWNFIVQRSATSTTGQDWRFLMEP